jgi:hypothetical protein
MNQIINIFRKDFRQHWYVIVLPLAILVAFDRFKVFRKSL